MSTPSPKSRLTPSTPHCRSVFGNWGSLKTRVSEEVLGFANRWYTPALGSAGSMQISDLQLRVITPVYFLATKLEAFRARGEGDVSGSHDLEDVITVIDGRAEIIEEVRSAPADVRTFIASEFQQLLTTRAFVDALRGFLLPDDANQARLPMLLERLTALAASGN